MKKNFLFVAILLIIVLLTTQANAMKTCLNNTCTPGIDFNLTDFVTDENGALDTDFSADCNLTIKYDTNATLMLNQVTMLDDPILPGEIYYPINASETTTWQKGEYSAVERCTDYNHYGTEKVSFVIDTNINQLFDDYNAKGKGLSSDQNQLLYDINFGITNLQDNNGPIIVFDYPKNGAITSSNLVKVNFYDYRFLFDVNVAINGLPPSDFNQYNDCFFYDNNKTCIFSDQNFVLNSWNDINVTATDDKGNTNSKDTNFYYSSPAMLVVVTPNGNQTQLFMFSPVKIEDFNFFIEDISENSFVLHSFSKKAGVTSFDYNLLIYNLDSNRTAALLSGNVNIGVGEGKNSIMTGPLPSKYYLLLSLESNGTTFEVSKTGQNFGVFSLFINAFFSNGVLFTINGVSITFSEAVVIIFVFIVFLVAFIFKRKRYNRVLRQQVFSE